MSRWGSVENRIILQPPEDSEASLSLCSAPRDGKRGSLWEGILSRTMVCLGMLGFWLQGQGSGFRVLELVATERFGITRFGLQKSLRRTEICWGISDPRTVSN